MRRFPLISLTAILAVSGIAANVQPMSPAPDQAFGQIPLGFESNVGQTDARVKFLARGNGYTALLTSNEAVIQLVKKAPAALDNLSEAPNAAAKSNKSNMLSATVRLQLLDENPDLSITPGEPMPARITYLRRNGTADMTRPSLFQTVRYANVWPGVTLVFYGNQRRLEYDLIVAPGTPVSAIHLAFEGPEKIQVDPATGDLVLATQIGDLRQTAPRMYQEIDNRRVPVDGKYTANGREIGFLTGAYDKTKPLVIDPTLSFGDVWGGSGQDVAEAVAVDAASGAIYVAGHTTSLDFPSSNGTVIQGPSDAFVSKVSRDGTQLLFSIYIGGSFDDGARGIALDASGNIYITGDTQSSDFPRTWCGDLVACQPPPVYWIQPKFFVVELSPYGSILYSGVFGGSQANYGNAIAIGDTGAIAVVGRTYSPDFPVVNSKGYLRGESDAFVTVLSAPQKGFGNPVQILFSTLLGGGGNESAKSVAMIPVRGRVKPTFLTYIADIVVGGWTSSYDFPVTSGVSQPYYGGGDADGFIVRISVDRSAATVTPEIDGAITYSTYLGAEGEDVVYGVTADSYGNVHATGYTGSYHFPTTYRCFQTYYGGGNSDAFLVKLDGRGKLVYGSYFGGAGDDYGRAVLVGFGAVYIVGFTDSPNLPLTSDALQPGEAGAWDAFAAWFLDDEATLAYATYAGTWGDDFVYSAALDGQGNLIFAGSTNGLNNGATNVLLLNINVGHVHAF